MTRAGLLIILGFALAWIVILGAAVNLIRHPSPPPINHCIGSDAANRWCIK